MTVQRLVSASQSHQAPGGQPTRAITAHVPSRHGELPCPPLSPGKPPATPRPLRPPATAASHTHGGSSMVGDHDLGSLVPHLTTNDP
jgi:hypothetical protein